MKQIYRQASELQQRTDGVIKIVGHAATTWDNIELEQFRHSVDPQNNRATILINFGSHGAFSRVSNKFLTPVGLNTKSRWCEPRLLSIAGLKALRTELNIDW